MNYYITGSTNQSQEEKKELSISDSFDFAEFTGSNAGICYMKDKYFAPDSSVTDCAKAIKRAGSTLSTGHHSVADHYKVTILFEDISKMLAIILNSLQDYSTSEKSGRYTEMTSSSVAEQDLYDKWKDICKGLIMEAGEQDEKKAIKLAQENARYFLSVFTRSTTMSYTTSIRQWNYIYDWSKKIVDYINRNMYDFENEYFYKNLQTDMIFLMDTIENADLLLDGGSDKEFLSNIIIRDTKDRNFDILYSIYNNVEQDKILKYFVNRADNFGFTYNTHYYASFVQLAQAQRHRTLKYIVDFDLNNKSKTYFIPEFIKGTKYEEEWVKDMEYISEYIPQGTMIKVMESGDLPSFLLKCKERLCTRAQIEICLQTEKTLKNYYESLINGRISNIDLGIIKDMFSSYISPENEVYTKCQIIGGCKESCRRANECFSRKY